MPTADALITTDVADFGQLKPLPDSTMTGEIIGYLYAALNELGYGYHERYYQRAFEQQLKAHQFSFQRELSVPIQFRGKSIGRYRLDFLIDDQLIVELKVGQAIHPRFVKQVLAYLQSSPYQLALIALFAKDGVTIKRLIQTKRTEDESVKSAFISASAVRSKRIVAQS